MNIDKIARELQEEITKAHFGHTVENPLVEKLIKAAIQSVMQEARNSALDEAIKISDDDEAYKPYAAGNGVIKFGCSNAIRSLKRSE